MDSARWRRVGEIFDAVIDTPKHDRTALLDRLCGDGDMRREVEELLAADVLGDVLDAHTSVLRGAAAAAWAHDQDAAAPCGAVIGSWRVVRELGRGGMGVVLLVDRADGQFEQRAALKLIKRGMDSEALLARFRRERQILARLSHPNIARLLDGGVAADGRSYLVMEYIDGIPLPDYCAQRKLGLRARIDCLLQVCAALQFAHRQLVVHLDIKPSNVLVTESGEVKLLDFGIARLLGAEQTGLATQPGIARDSPLTPAYAAPEQLRGESVSTATDIYSLGCLTYEVLTGRRPFGLDEATSLRPPSSVFDRAHPELPSSAAARRADPPVPPRNLRGDLDTILLKALQPEPERRYVTIEALAQDLRGHVQGAPIAARRDSALYRTGKFVRRHRVGVALALTALLALLATTTFAVWEARSARAQAQRAETVTDFLIGIFRVADPRGTPGGAKFSARDVLDSGAKRLQTGLDREPQLASSLAEVLGKVYGELGEYDRAIALLQRSLVLRGDRKADDGAVADTISMLARAQYEKGDYASALQNAQHALNAHRSRGKAASPMIAADLGLQGEIARRQGDFDHAEALLKQALDMSRATLVAPHAQIAAQLNELAALYSDMHRLPEGMTSTEQALAMFRGLYGDNHLDVAENLVNLAVFRMQTERIAEALPLFDEAIAICRRLLPPDHPMLADALAGHARAFDRLGRYVDAEPQYLEALAMQRRLLGNQHPALAATLNNLAVLHFHEDDYAGAADFSRQAMAIWAAQGKPEHPFALISKSHLAVALRESGDLAEGERIGREVLEARRRLAGDNNLAVSISLDDLGVTLRVLGRGAEALVLQRQARSLREKVPGMAALESAVAQVQYALSTSAAGDQPGARVEVDAALTALTTMKSLSPMQIGNAQLAKAHIALLQNDVEAGCAAARQALDSRPPDDPITGWRHAEAQSVYGECLGARKQFAQARHELQAAMATLQRVRGREHWMTLQVSHSLQSMSKA
jgi:tetratricopeptide (TPR) repeat protein/predicted Ser/Thr protein kinase